MIIPLRPLRTASAKPGSRSRRYVLIFLSLLGLVLLGTVIVLSTVQAVFGIPANAFVTEEEVPWIPGDAISKLADPIEYTDELDLVKRAEWDEIPEPDDGIFDIEPTATQDLDATPTTTAASTQPATIADSDSDDGEWGLDGKGTGGYWMKADWSGTVARTESWEHLYNISVREGEKVPRIIHQTWIDSTLPPQWRQNFRECREGMPDYELMLWTDDLSRKFMATHYPEHLEMFVNYRYNIQRADSIRYFVLHHFGGIYMDLDIGCRRRMDPLLQGKWQVLLPVTKPVGVSNDLLTSPPKSAFYFQTINALKTWNVDLILNYPTVMFSTGPMFLSAQFRRYMRRHPVTPEDPDAHVRIMPTNLYGKNAPIEAVPHSFFAHFYGSSWHSDDAGFITWLGRWGRNLLIFGMVVLVIGAVRLMWSKVAQAGGICAAVSGLTGRGPQYTLLPVAGSVPEHGRASPTQWFGSSGPNSPTFEVPPEISSALRRAGNMILAAPALLVPNGGRRQRGWLFFAPAAFQPTHGRRRTASEASQIPLRAPRARHDFAPPPYESEPSDGMEEVDAFLKRAEEDSDRDCESSSGSTSKRLE